MLEDAAVPVGAALAVAVPGARATRMQPGRGLAARRLPAVAVRPDMDMHVRRPPPMAMDEGRGVDMGPLPCVAMPVPVPVPRRQADMRRGMPVDPMAVPVPVPARRRADMPRRMAAVRVDVLPVEGSEQRAGADRDQPAIALADRRADQPADDAAPDRAVARPNGCCRERRGERHDGRQRDPAGEASFPNSHC